MAAKPLAVIIVIASVINGRAGPRIGLKDLVSSSGLDIGTTYPWSALSETSEKRFYEGLLLREFNTVAPEGSLGFSTDEPSWGHFTGDCAPNGRTCAHHGAYTRRDGSLDFGDLDRLVAFAQHHRLKVNFGLFAPLWVTRDKGYNKAQLSAVLKNYVHTLAGHYRGKVSYYLVANEAISVSSLYGGQGSVWEDIDPQNKLAYVELLFRWAHEADPSVKLIYNDYMAEGIGHKSDRVYDLVVGLKRRGVGIDGVGFQAHLTLGFYMPSMRKVKQNMARLKRAGLDVYITEADVAAPTPVTERELKAQGRAFAALLKVCLQSSNCRSFNVWGLTDKYSWIQPRPPEYNYSDALLFDRSYAPKPAYEAIWNLLASWRGGRIGARAQRR